MRQPLLVTCALICLCVSPVVGRQQGATIRVEVRAADTPVENAEVLVTGARRLTDPAGRVTLTVAAGTI